MLQIVDFYGPTFVVFILSIFEIVAFCLIYGVNRICHDIKFMLGFTPGIFWRICWRFVVPLLMTAIVVYYLVSFEKPMDGAYEYPVIAHVVGWCLAAVGLLQVPIFAVVKIVRREEESLIEVKWNVNEVSKAH